MYCILKLLNRHETVSLVELSPRNEKIRQYDWSFGGLLSTLQDKILFLKKKLLKVNIFVNWRYKSKGGFVRLI